MTTVGRPRTPRIRVRGPASSSGARVAPAEVGAVLGEAREPLPDAAGPCPCSGPCQGPGPAQAPACLMLPRRPGERPTRREADPVRTTRAAGGGRAGLARFLGARPPGAPRPPGVPRRHAAADRRVQTPLLQEGQEVSFLTFPQKETPHG
ncbi:hypothetical protein SCWH03_37760 [Streptomyces pacificus]|uniref:Uncharacterized protein n=1 Tax=Streptomyces pacificus TaxID=2705029 RepID=A0A6A0AY88_9ACTN|nr:hypothetical protein SCWH03_37760 [Streptomyces pacificus]